MIYLLGLLLAFVLVAIYSNPATRACRWREYRQEDGARWVCVHCGAETLGEAGQKPKTCLRDPRP
ncbi:hypothetical protein [Tropicibacter naphthalenivorans]|uniref:Uncharacterized protein n=1 Tax=Tropicibacter naphthalenivorans TaxID=441103 RepID=A0A0P1GS20_9RHOB|nr:hypothetical protein [Tropicibacter naphthalenivorans]CUH77964.1 hypothetical protein TRN7648_01722 [Tropicibacter naphthalenivorans]SMC94814.1 hypothetical protein SAMN04488093_107120 [Tropicibacter naphthalenivorans]